jgi:hypothetical protein
MPCMAYTSTPNILLFHTVLEWSDDKYALLRRVLARRQTFFQDIQTLMRYMVFDDWEHLMDFIPTVSLDVISLVASSCEYYRGQIE